MLFFAKQIPHSPHALKYLVRNDSAHMTFFDLCKSVNPDTKQARLSKIPFNEKFVYEIHLRYSIDHLADGICSFTEILPEIIIDKLQNNKCLLLISHSHEGYSCSGNTVKRIKELLEKDSIEMHNVILFCNSTTPSPRIVADSNGVYCGFNYFESTARNKFALENIAEYKSLRLDNILACNIKNKFLCLNRVPREHRVMFLMLLNRENLLSNFLWSLPDIDVVNASDITKFDVSEIWGQTNTACVFKNTTPVERVEFKRLLPSVVDVRAFEYNQWNTLNKKFITSTGIYVVTETLFGGANTPCFFTEKIFKPIYYKMPFIVVGTPGYLKHMRTCGYKTFSNLWSEDYDDVIDEYGRLSRIIKLIEYISRLDTEEFHKLLAEALYITACNYSRLMSRSSDKYIADFIAEKLSARITL
jgi:hypothetical protein